MAMWDKTNIRHKKQSWPYPGLMKASLESQKNDVSSQFSEQLLEQPTVHPFKLALQTLSSKERAAFILRYQQHQPQTQIAAMLGLSEEALNQLFDHIFNKLSTGIYSYFKVNKN